MWKLFGSDKPRQSAVDMCGPSLAERIERQAAVDRSSCSRLTSRRSPVRAGHRPFAARALNSVPGILIAWQLSDCRRRRGRFGLPTVRSPSRFLRPSSTSGGVPSRVVAIAGFTWPWLHSSPRAPSSPQTTGIARLGHFKHASVIPFRCSSWSFRRLRLAARCRPSASSRSLGSYCSHVAARNRRADAENAGLEERREARGAPNSGRSRFVSRERAVAQGGPNRLRQSAWSDPHVRQ
jgi:hypothetical protein